jgi:class 3 adenylate cyclase
MEALLRLRAQIDDEVTQRFAHELCLMMADVVGSTRFYQKHGDVKGRLLIQRHNDTLFPLITKAGGKVVKTIGDGIMASFPNPHDALDSALAIQQTLWQRNQHALEEDVLRTKLSLHYGAALVEDNDIYGDLVNTSARLNAIAEPDQILVSQPVYDHVKDRTGLTFLPLETLYFKEGEKSVSAYEALWLQNAEEEGKINVFRHAQGPYSACFYCGLREHLAADCPSKHFRQHAKKLERLGYLPTPHILRLLQEEDLNNTSSEATEHRHLFEAFYEVAMPYQLRFILKIWLSPHHTWHDLMQFTVPTTHPLVGSRLWLGLDCIRVRRYDQAKVFLDDALGSNPQDYKPHVALGFLAMEQDDPTAALHHWREAITLTKSSLQEAYIRLLLYRLYSTNGKTDLATRELQRALSKNRGLHEAMYRQIAIMVEEGKDERVLQRLQSFIHDERTAFLKVLLDPAFASLHSTMYPLLKEMFEVVKGQVLEHLPGITQDINALRAWYRAPTKEIERIEKTLGNMRRHIKSDSYFGYNDALDEGAALQAQSRQLLIKRKSFLHKRFATVAGNVQASLQKLAARPRTAPRAAKLLTKLRSVQNLPRTTPVQYWHAWDELQRLHTTVDSLITGKRRRTTAAGFLRVLLFAVGGSVLADVILVSTVWYFMSLSNVRPSPSQFLVVLAIGTLGGLALGGGLGWYWERSKS